MGEEDGAQRGGGGAFVNDGARSSAFPLRLRPPPVALAVLFAAVAGGLLVLLSGHDPLLAYREIVEGSLSLGSLPDTLNWATPLVGMTLVAAIPLRGGMVNLGGDGQLVVGGLIAALLPLALPGPGALISALALAAAALSAGLYAALAAWGETRHGVPMLISSLLLSYPAVGVTSYLVRFPFRDVTTGLPQTAMVPAAARLHAMSGALNVGSLMIATIAVAAVFVDRRTVAGYELRMRGKNARFAGYGGVNLERQAMGAVFASGAIAGLVGAIVVLGSQFRFIDGALVTPAYTWSGLMAALLAGGEPVGAILAGLFFAALQTGGFAMQRETAVPRVLTLVLQAIVILFLAMRRGVGRRPA
ncbi:MAG: ABC transporter permease [Hyphomicrobiales bacterium]|nr:ABC transporter permease [Hyphomicrobiales bacterium]